MASRKHEDTERLLLGWRSWVRAGDGGDQEDEEKQEAKDAKGAKGFVEGYAVAEDGFERAVMSEDLEEIVGHAEDKSYNADAEGTAHGDEDEACRAGHGDSLQLTASRRQSSPQANTERHPLLKLCDDPSAARTGVPRRRHARKSRVVPAGMTCVRDGLFDLLFEGSQEVEGVERFEIVEVGGAELFEDRAVEGGKKEVLVAITAMG